MWDLPGPGLEPVSLALAGGFLTTVPPGKTYKAYFEDYIWLEFFTVIECKRQKIYQPLFLPKITRRK